MAYVGTPIDTTNTFTSLQGKRFNGDGSATDFTLDVAPSSTLDIEVFVGNVRQDPNSAYTLSGTTLTFSAAPPTGTNNIYVVHQAKAIGTMDVPATFLSDAQTFSGGLTANGGVVFNEDSADVNFRIEDNNNANAFFVEGGASAGQPLIGIGTGSPEGEIHTMCSGIGQSLFDSYDGNTGELALRTSRNATVGSHTLSNSGDGGRLRQYVSDGNSFEVCAQIELGADANAADGDVPGHMLFATTPDGAALAGIVEVMRMTSTQEISTGGETGPDVDAGGLCLDTNANDANSLTFKNSDVGHPFTDIQEADTFLAIKKASGASGGAQVEVFGEGVSSTIWVSHAVNANTTQSTSGRANFEIDTYVDSGTDRTGMSADHNIFMVKTGASAKFIVEGNGMLHSDGGAQSAYDAYDDAQLVRAFDLSHGKGTINSKFDKFIGYNHEKLAELGIVGREDDGTPNHFINITLLQRLHNGAIWQQYEKHNQLLDAVYDLAKEAVGEEKANAILDKHEVKRLQ